jgi:hypothetical protein
VAEQEQQDEPGNGGKLRTTRGLEDAHHHLSTIVSAGCVMVFA